MQPGSELDALIATKVMGWHVASLIPDAPAYQDCLWQWPDGRETGYWLTEHASQECPGFSPSTDISAAWEVIGKFIGWQITDHGKDGISVILGVLGEPGKVGFHTVKAMGESAPHAICLAALKACNAS